MDNEKFRLLKNKLYQEKSLTLKIKVHPQSSKTGITSVMADGTIKVNVQAAPEKNKANKELIKYVSKYFEVPSQAVSIVQGHTSNVKILKILFE